MAGIKGKQVREDRKRWEFPNIVRLTAFFLIDGIYAIKNQKLKN